MRVGRSSRVFTLFGLGFAGLVGGHVLGYALCIPDDHHRTLLLESSGHSYLPSVSRAALVLVVAAAISAIATGYRSRSQARANSIVAVAIRLARLQSIAFIALEVFERFGTDAGFSTLSSRILVVGVLCQLLVALFAGLLLFGLRRVGEVLRAGHPPIAVCREPELPVHDHVLPFRRAWLRDPARGPPAVAIA